MGSNLSGESFVECGKFADLNDKKTSVVSQKSRPSTVYGDIIIPTMIKDEKYVWKFKINKLGDSGVCIGIDQYRKVWGNQCDETFYNNRDTLNFSWHCSGCKYISGKKQKNKKKYGEDDIITMTLEFPSWNNSDKGKLTFTCTDPEPVCMLPFSSHEQSIKDMVQINVKCDDDIKYRMAATTFGKDETITLISFEGNNHPRDDDIDDQKYEMSRRKSQKPITDEITQFFDDMGLPEYAQVFANEGIDDPNQLKSMNLDEKKLQDQFNIDKYFHRIKIIGEIGKL